MSETYIILDSSQRPALPATWFRPHALSGVDTLSTSQIRKQKHEMVIAGNWVVSLVLIFSFQTLSTLQTVIPQVCFWLGTCPHTHRSKLKNQVTTRKHANINKRFYLCIYFHRLMSPLIYFGLIDMLVHETEEVNLSPSFI